MKNKNHNLKILIITIISVILQSLCSCSNNEEEVDMGHGYYYIPSQDATIDQIMFDGNGIYTYMNNSIVPLIYPKIKEYKYDSLYIIVKQDFDFRETNILLSSLIFYPVYFKYDKDYVPLDEKYVRDAPNFMTMSMDSGKKYVDSIMHLDSHIKKMMEHTENYYIIDKKKQEVMGPFSKAEFNEKREALQMPEELIFE